MGWLWTIQIMVDAILVLAVWRLVSERKSSPGTPFSERDSELHREDFERYQEALSDLCDRMNHEAEMWMTQLERKTKVVRQVIHEIDRSATHSQEPVLDPSSFSSVRGQSSVSTTEERRGIREEAAFLRSQGYTVEQIARQLKVGQREVQLMLSLQPR